MTFEPVTFGPPAPARVPGAAPGLSVIVTGIIPIGDGIDVLWGGPSLYLMKEKGVLKLVWQPIGANVSFTSVSFDGKYVWAAAQRYSKGALLMALDPATERVWEFTADDGLPLMQTSDDNYSGRGGYQQLRVAGVSPGKACVAGHWGTTWLAICTLDPEAGKAVRVFHEARGQPDRNDPEHWRSPYLAFTPGFIAMLSDETSSKSPPPPGGGPSPLPQSRPAKVERRVLLVRSSTHEMALHPLLIDPDAMTVRVLEAEAPSALTLEHVVAVHRGRLYWLERGPLLLNPPVGPSLWSLGFPDFAKARVAGPAVPERDHAGQPQPSIPFEFAAFDGERVVVASREWWLAPALGEPFHELRGDPPGRRAGPPPRRAAPGPQPPAVRPAGVESVMAVWPSTHYGLLVMANAMPGGQRFYEVKFRDHSPATLPSSRPAATQPATRPD